MILADVLERVTAMTVAENRGVGSKERPGGTRNRNDQLAGRDSEQKNS